MARTLLSSVLALELVLLVSSATHAQEGSGPRLDRFGDPLPDGALARLGTLRFHDAGRAAYSPDGKIIATAGDNEVTLWDVDTSKKIRQLSLEKERWPDGVLFSHDGKKLAVTSSMGQSIQIWDLKTFDKVVLQQADGSSGGGDWSHSTAFSSDDKTLFGATSSDLFVWDVASGKKINEFPIRIEDKRVDVRLMVFSEDGKLAATQGDKKVHLWDTETGKLLREIELLDGGEAMSFSRDGKLLVVPNNRHWMNIFSVETGKKVHSLPVAERVVSTTFSSDGKTLAAVSNLAMFSSSAQGEQVIQLWDVTKLEAPPVKYAAPGIHYVTFSPDGKTLAWGCCGQTLCFMDRATGKDLNPTASHSGAIKALVYFPDGKRIASASEDGTIRIWDAATGESLSVLQGHIGEVHALALFPNGRLLASCGRDCTLRLWDTEHGKALSLIDDDGSPVVAAAFSPDGKRFASGGHSGLTYLRNPATGKKIEELKTHSIAGLAYAPDGKTLAVLNDTDNKLLLHDLSNYQGKEVPLERGLSSVAYSPNGKFIALGCDEVVLLVDTVTNNVVRKLPGHFNGRGCVVFTPDGHYLASVSDGYSDKADRTIRVFEVATGTEIYSFKKELPIFAAAFSPDGSKLVVGGTDATALILDLTNLTGKKRSEKLTDDELAARWESLTESDATKAYEARADLLHAPKSVVPFLAKHVQPAPTVDAKRVEAWIKKLDSEEFRERDEGNKELEQLGELVREPLRKALDNDPPPEMKRRLQALLANLDGITSSQLRTLRSIEILESIGTPEALEIVEKLTRGNPDGFATAASRTVIERKRRKSDPLPEIPKPQDNTVVESPPPGPVLPDRDGDPMPPGAIARLGSARWRLASEPRRIIASADGKKLAVVSLSGFEILDSNTGRRLERAQGSFGWGVDPRMSLAMSSDWQMVATFEAGDRAESVFVIFGRDKTEKVRIEYRRNKDAYPLVPEEVECDGNSRAWSEYLSAAEFAPDGKMLVGSVRFDWRCSGGGVFKEVKESHLIAWDAATGKELWKSPALVNEINTILFSPDGKTITVADEAGVSFWDATKGKKLRHWESKGASFSASYSPDRAWLATASNEEILLWEVATGKVVQRLELTGNELGEMKAITFSADNKLLAGGVERTIRFWDPRTGKAQGEITDFPSPVETLAFSSDGKTLFSGHKGENVLRRWDVATRKPVGEFYGPIDPVRALAFSKNSHTILALSAGEKYYLWEAETGKPCTLPKKNDDPLTDWLASSGRAALLTCEERFRRQFGTLLTGKLDGLDEVPSLIGWSVDGQHLLLETKKDNMPCLVVVKIHKDLVKGKDIFKDVVREFEWKDGDEVRGALSPDGKILVAAGEDVVCFFDVATGKERRYVQPSDNKQHRIQSVRFSADGSRIALADEEGHVRVLAVRDGRKIGEIVANSRREGLTHLAFSPDGQTLLTTSSNSPVFLWEVASGQMVRRLEAATYLYSPDNRLLAQSAGTLKILDLYAGQILRECKAERDGLGNFAFSPNSKLLAASCADTTIVVWPTSPAEAKPGKPLDEKGLAEVLEKGNAPEAYEAIGRMIADPERALPFLERVLKSAPKVDGEHKQPPDKEQAAMSTEDLLHVRVIQALERIGTKPARQLLENIAKGAESSPRTRAAAEALGRMAVN